MANKASSTPSRFPVVGNAAANARNASGEASANTKRGGPMQSSAGGMLEAATANHRQGVLERHGAQWRINATLYAPNAASAGDEQRNYQVVPSAVGSRDFWNARSAAQR